MDGDLEAVARTLADIAEGIKRLGTPLAGLDVLELGPGRTAEVSIALALVGARSARGIDTRVQVPADWAEPHRVATVAAMLAGKPGGPLRQLAEPDGLRDVDFSAPLRVSFHAYDGGRMPLPDGSVDLIVSKSVLEHVAPRHLARLVPEMARVLRPGGGMVHVIDLRDHMWIDGDAVRGDWLDALRYPEPLFRAMFANRSTAINRLRSHEWSRTFEDAGFEVVDWDPRRYPFAASFHPRALRPRWRGLPDDELAIGQVRVVLRRSG
jgi:SAM-dependent methyltransferase